MGKEKSWPEQDLHTKKITIQQLRRGYHGPPRFLSGLWRLMDKIISKWLGIEPLRQDKLCIISTELKQHRGQPVPLNDGTVVTPGDRIIELHMNNAWFLNMKAKLVNSAGEIRWRVPSAFAEDLRYLAKKLARESYAAEVKALYGTTLLYSPAQRLGFTVKDFPKGLRNRLTTFYLCGLRQTYHLGKNKAQAKMRRPPVLKEVWISKSRLIDMYYPNQLPTNGM